MGSNYIIIKVFFSIISKITNSSVHLMFPYSLWIINVLYVCASVPISSSGTATHQGTLSYFYPLCTRKYYRNKYVLHPSGTSSVTVQIETGLKIHFSINGTLLDHGWLLIKLDSLYISTYFKVSKIIKRLKSLSLQKSTRNRYLVSFQTFLIY